LTETSPRGAREVRRWRTVYDSAGTWGVSHLVRGAVASRWWKTGFYAVPCTHLKWHFASCHFDPRKSPQCEISRRPFSLATFLRLMRTATNVKAAITAQGAKSVLHVLQENVEFRGLLDGLRQPLAWKLPARVPNIRRVAQRSVSSTACRKTAQLN